MAAMTAERRTAASLSQLAGGVLRAVGMGVAAGFVAGLLVGGIGSRIAMYISRLATDPEACARMMTENGFRCGEFTIGGSVLLLVTGAFGGIFGGLIYAAVRPWIPGRRDSIRGLVFGMALLAAAGLAVIEARNVDFQRFGPPLLNVPMYALFYPLYGLLVVPLYERMRRAVSPTDGVTVEPGRGRRVAIAIAGAPGLIVMSIALVAGSVEAARSPHLDAIAFATIAIFAFLILPLTRLAFTRDGGRFERPGDLARWRWGAASYALLAVPLLVGLTATLDNARRILG